jgi:tetratricopeptide (TPR) repeat protein
VNLAARVMSRASLGEILATDEVLQPSRTLFEISQLEPFMVKGKSQPVVASTVGPAQGTRDGTSRIELPLVGREAELAAFEEVLGDVRRGSGRLVRVIGEVGVGKSRLLGAFRELAADLEQHQLTCELHRATTPYGAARKLFRSLVGIPADTDPSTAGQQLLAFLEGELPGLADWAPLLAMAFGAEVPATTATADLDPQYVRSRLHAAVTELLTWRWPRSVLLTVEDAQWMDEASVDLLRSISERLDQRPWVICITRREAAPDEDGSGPALTLPLQPLDEASTLALAVLATAEAPLPAHEMVTLVERSGGNPLFLEELVTAAREEGGIDQLPDSIEALTTARIDRLPQRDRHVLSQVSVLGQRFPLHLAAAVLPPEDGDEVWDRLGAFLERDGGTIRFRHALTRDVAYGSLRYRLRRELHAKVGDGIVEASGGDDEEQAALLSFHFFHAQRHEEALRYSLVAAEQARMVYANAEAARFLEHALETARRIQGLPPSEPSRILEELGDVRDLMGAYRGAVAAYSSARRTLPPDPVAEARLVLKQARQHGWLSRYGQALRWIRRGLHLLEHEDGPAAATQRAQLTAWYARFCEEEGRHRLALRWSTRATELATEAGDAEALAHAHRIRGRAHANLGDIEAATAHWEEALTRYEQVEDLDGQAAMTNNLGALGYWLGDWSQAREYFRRAFEIYERVGDQDGVAVTKKNLGQLLCEQGRLAEAAELVGDALRIWQAAGHRAGVATAQRELAWIAARSGRHAEATALLDEAHAAFQVVGARVEDIDTLGVVAECHLLTGAPGKALTVLTEALDLDVALSGTSAQSPLLHRLHGYALMRTGAFDAARIAFEASLRAGRGRDADYEVALTLRALAELASTDGLAADGLAPDVLAAQSQAILDRLDVVWTPTIPAAPLTSA